jgi:hypothetical protein
MKNNILIIYCGVKFEFKEEAKKVGAKWDKEKKAWYFKFDLIEFQENENMHTFQYKPFSITFIKCDEYLKSAPIASYKFYDYIYQMASNRNKKHITDNTEQPEVDKLYVLKRN